MDDATGGKTMGQETTGSDGQGGGGGDRQGDGQGGGGGATGKVVALVDGSIYSESVCEHAAWISARTGAPVELIHVLGRREAPASADLSGAIRLGARTRLMEELAELDAQRARLVAQRGRAILEDARAIVERAAGGTLAGGPSGGDGAGGGATAAAPAAGEARPGETPAADEARPGETPAAGAASRGQAGGDTGAAAGSADSIAGGGTGGTSGGGTTGTTTRLRHGDIVEAIAEIESDARVIVVGKRGEAADFAKGHLGSNLERIVRAAHRPVLVAARAFRPIETVLLAYDGGRSAMKAVDHIARSPLFAGLSVTVATVGPDRPEARKGLADARALLAGAGIASDIRLLPGQPEAELGRLVEEEGFGMVVMGAYGHSRIRSLVIGSTTTEMVRSCKVPVLLMR